MGRMIYSHYEDNVAPNATVSVNTGDEDADYPAANLVDRLIVKPAQLTTTTGSWVFDFGSAQRVDWAALPMHNLDAGLDVRIQANATDSWGGPTVDEPIIIPTYREDGLPVPCWLDLTAAAGYDVGGFRYWRLEVAGTNAAAVKVGELLLLNVKRTLDPNINWGVQLPESRPVYDNRTPFGYANKYDLGVTLRRLQGTLDTTDAGLALLRAWWRSTRGTARSFAIVPDEDVNEAWVAEFTGDLGVTLQINNRNNIPITFEEVSRGLFL
jgi:hypothetical protein